MASISNYKSWNIQHKIIWCNNSKFWHDSQWTFSRAVSLLSTEIVRVHTLWYEYQTNTIEYTNSWHIFIVFIPMCWAGSFSCTPWHIFISYFNSHCQLSKMFKLANKCDFTTETISIAMPSRFVLLAWAVLHMLDRFCPTAHNDLAHSFETGWFSQRSTEYWLQKPKQWSILCRKQCLCSLMEKRREMSVQHY